MNDLIYSLKSIATSLEKISLNNSQSVSYQWWDTQWFSSLLGAIVGGFIVLLSGFIKDYFSWRQKTLDSWYSHIVENQQPEHLFKTALITRYGGTETQNGETKIIPEKSFSERSIIEFRKSYKYWNLPISYLRFLFWRYENSLKELSNTKEIDYKKSLEYLKSEKIFMKIIKLSEKRTGENQWTI